MLLVNTDMPKLCIACCKLADKAKGTNKGLTRMLLSKQACGMSFLLEAGAKKRNGNDFTPERLASEMCHVEAACFLLEPHANNENAIHSGFIPTQSYARVVWCLVPAGKDKKYGTPRGRRSMHHVA